MDAEAVAEASALLEATAQTRQELTSTVAASVVAEVRAFDGWYDSAAIGVFAKRLSAVTGSGQRQTAVLTSSYSSRLLRILLGRTPGRAATGGRVSVVDLRGVPLTSVYGRLADEYRWLRSDGVSVDGVQAPALVPQEAIDRVITRAQTTVDQSLTLALVHQWASVSDAAPTGITGYRRVIHPELPTEASLRDGKAPPPVCGLCVAASTRVYRRGDLMPVHANCRCLPITIVGEHGGSGDVGSVINESDVGRLYADAGGSTAAADLKRTKYRVEEHAELGPQLVPAIVRTTPYVRRQRTAAQRAAARESAARSAASQQAAARTGRS